MATFAHARRHGSKKKGCGEFIQLFGGVASAWIASPSFAMMGPALSHAHLNGGA
jgi:hypothetical protein